MLKQPEFAAIEHYLSNSKPLKLYQLAGKIADVYDQYLVYRPDWITHWEAGQNDLPDHKDTNICEAHPWQPILWRALVSTSEALGESSFHRANLHHTLLESLHYAASQQSETKTAKPLMVFGISAMPMQQLEVLNALAEIRDVLIFWFNPSQHYWGDVVDQKTQAKAQVSPPGLCGLSQPHDGRRQGQGSLCHSVSDQQAGGRAEAVGRACLVLHGEQGRNVYGKVGELQKEEEGPDLD